MATQPSSNDLPERRSFQKWLENWKDETLICAEGYLWEFERRGYISSGEFVPGFILNHLNKVEEMTEDFINTGSDVALAFQYYTHRRKMSVHGNADLTYKINMTALECAKKIAEKTGTIFAGGLCNTFVEDDNVMEKEAQIESIFREQLEWSVEVGCEYVLAETLSLAMEGRIAAKLGKEMGMPIVASFNLYNQDAMTLDGFPVEEACVQAYAAGATVVGVNCGYGPRNIIPVVKRIREAVGPDVPLCAVPCGFRQPDERKSWMQTIDPLTGYNAYSEDMGAFGCTATDIQEFTLQCVQLGVTYLGICCGNYGALTRRMAETVHRTTNTSKYGANRAALVRSISKWCGPEHFRGLPPRPGRKGQELALPPSEQAVAAMAAVSQQNGIH